MNKFLLGWKPHSRQGAKTLSSESIFTFAAFASLREIFRCRCAGAVYET